MHLVIVSSEENDVTRVLRENNVPFERVDTTSRALASTPDGSAIMVLADMYPNERTALDDAFYHSVRNAGHRLYVEFPSYVPHMNCGDPTATHWERGVIASDVFEPAIPHRSIVAVNGCTYVPIGPRDSHIAIARVAGLDTAVYGLPADAVPILTEVPELGALVATTALSRFVTARYAPDEAWSAIWRWIVTWLTGNDTGELRWTPAVLPAFASDSILPDSAVRDSVRRGVDWYTNARLYVDSSWSGEAERRLNEFPDGTGSGPDMQLTAGDGSLGMIEGASSSIRFDGSQDWRYFLRADCMGEAAMANAVAGNVLGDDRIGTIGANLCDFILGNEEISGGSRSDPASPHYGLLNWDTRAGDGVYYGDDNARSVLGMLCVAAAQDTDKWDERLLRALLANVRTTGPLGFREKRIDSEPLETNGWEYYFDNEIECYAPHYESWLWACYLWAYRATGYELFLICARNGIARTMKAYPDEWNWTNGIQQERARMLLPLSWLVRIDDTEEHRGWLRQMTDELLRTSSECGAIREELGIAENGQYGVPQTNEEYGTREAPLIHENGDPVADLLYTSNFAFIGLHEAAHATGDEFYIDSRNRLADFLVRIQVRSETHQELDGAWFRAFEFDRWKYWASNADLGWGAWSIESGWTQGWIVTTLALGELGECGELGTSYWDFTAGSKIDRHLDRLVAEMLPEEA
jgi:hypothetical protein